jgi:hypothetical protein
VGATVDERSLVLLFLIAKLGVYTIGEDPPRATAATLDWAFFLPSVERSSTALSLDPVERLSVPASSEPDSVDGR